MIIGIGMDLCDISRMEKLLSDGRFLARFFSAEEQAYIQSKGKSAAQSMAGIYAAKEALAKAGAEFFIEIRAGAGLPCANLT